MEQIKRSSLPRAIDQRHKIGRRHIEADPALPVMILFNAR